VFTSTLLQYSAAGKLSACLEVSTSPYYRVATCAGSLVKTLHGYEASGYTILSPSAHHQQPWHVTSACKSSYQYRSFMLS